MKIIFLVFALFFGACSQKVAVKYVEKEVEIPVELFECKDVLPFYLDKNTTRKDWFYHILDLRLGYDECKMRLQVLKEHYGRYE